MPIYVGAHTSDESQSGCPSLCSKVWQHFSVLIKALVFLTDETSDQVTSYRLVGNRLTYSAQVLAGDGRKMLLQQHMQCDERERWMAVDHLRKGQSEGWECRH